MFSCPFRHVVLRFQPLPHASAGPREPLPTLSSFQSLLGRGALLWAGGQGFTNPHALDSQVLLARWEKLLSVASGCERGCHRSFL